MHVIDADGAKLATRRLPEGLAGIGLHFAELLATHAQQPTEVVIGIETDGVCGCRPLAAAGYQVYAVNPLSVARYRDRYQVLAAKSDASDAKVLADLVRTDRHNHRRVAGDTPEVNAIKVLARAHQNLIWARNRKINALRAVRYGSTTRVHWRPSTLSPTATPWPWSSPHPGDAARTDRRPGPLSPQHGGRQRISTPGTGDPHRVARPAARRPSRDHRRVRHHHPRGVRDDRRTQPADRRPRSIPGRAF